MSVYRAVNIFTKILPNSYSPGKNVFVRKDLFYKELISDFKKINLTQERYFRKSYGQFLTTMKKRRKIAGPERQRKRSDWFDWNYNAELYAFDKRLHENIAEDVLRSVFIQDSYVRVEEEKRKSMVVESVQLNMKSNTDLISRGQEVMSSFLKRYLRHCFKLVPEEGICAIHDYLTSDDILGHISFNIGTKDLIFSAEYPPSDNTLANTFKALVGAIATCNSVSRAETFVLDFVCPQLIGKDVFEMWDLDKPLEILNAILIKQNKKPTESRLIFESGRNTIEAIYHVGLYSQKQFLGKGAGETVAFAEEMAAHDALRRVFHLNESEKPLPLGKTAKNTEFNCINEHISIHELISESLEVNKDLVS